MLWNCQSNSSLIEYVAAALGWRKSNEKNERVVSGAVEYSHTHFEVWMRKIEWISRKFMAPIKRLTRCRRAVLTDREREVLLNLVRRKLTPWKTQLQPFISFRFLVFFSSGLSPWQHLRVRWIWLEALTSPPPGLSLSSWTLEQSKILFFSSALLTSHINHSISWSTSTFHTKLFFFSHSLAFLASRSLGVSNSIRNSTWWD